MKSLKVFVPLAFAALAVIGVLVFAFGGRGGGGTLADQTILMWGTLPSEGIAPILDAIYDEAEIKITYTEIEKENFENTFIQALANSEGPDLVLLPHDLFLAQKNKFFAISYESYTEASYRDTFIRAGEMFLAPEGIYALPFSVDPIIMYWNKDLFINEGIARPPLYWREFFSLASRLTKLDQNQNITQSFVAMGESGNITHAKEILSAMIMQTGEKIVGTGDRGYEVFLGDGASSVLDFYTEFSDPRLSSYSWNTALRESRDAFSAGELALYFGFASDYGIIMSQNPHLDIGVASFPQIEKGGIRSTYGNLYSIAMLKNSPKLSGAFNAAFELALSQYNSSIPSLLGIAPARLDQLGLSQTDNLFPIVFDSAIKTRVWLDPDTVETRKLFDQLVGLVTINNEPATQAISSISNQIREIIRKLE